MAEELYNKIDKFCNETDWSKYPTYEHALEAFIKGIVAEETKELQKQVDKMKCCENCKYNSYWGNELHCNYGLKEALQEDKLVECKNMDKWKLKE